MEGRGELCVERDVSKPVFHSFSPCCIWVRAVFPSPKQCPLLPSSPPPLPSSPASPCPPQEDFLRGRIKVNGKAGNLGSEVSLSREKNVISVTSDIQLSKR